MLNVMKKGTPIIDDPPKIINHLEFNLLEYIKTQENLTDLIGSVIDKKFLSIPTQSKINPPKN